MTANECAPGEAGRLAGIARAVRQPRRVQARSEYPPGPGCLNQPDHWARLADSNGDSNNSS
jgi:hypothetical protein